MELSSAVFRDILSPLAAFKEIRSRDRELAGERGSSAGEPESGQITNTSGLTNTFLQQRRLSTSEQNQPTRIPPFLSTLATQDASSPRYKWTIQGADPDARRFFAVPQFALDRPPWRIDVYLPPLEDYGPEVRSLLRPEEVIYSPRGDIPSLGISRWLASVLEQWCITYDSSSRHGPGRNVGKFQKDYESMPFGSRMLVTIGGLSHHSPRGGITTIDHEIYLVPDYDVEQGMLTVDSLREMWGDHLQLGQSDWPEVIDLEDLHLKRQFHEAISVVTISPSHSRTTAKDENGHNDGHHPESPEEERAQEGKEEKEWIFKSLTRDQPYLYNELKMFLSLSLKPLHKNIIPTPRYIVTKKGRFGGRRGVCGFVLEYFSEGSLKQFLVDRSSQELASPLEPGSSPGRGLTSSGDMISLEQKVQWAKQITRALIHINTSNNGTTNPAKGGSGSGLAFGFYPDLKPDNIVLRPSTPSFSSPSSSIPPKLNEKDDSLKAEGEGGQALYDAILIDLEQRGGWFSWSPPEISYLEYLQMILGVSPDDIDSSQDYDLDGLEDFQEDVGTLLGEYYSFCFDDSHSQPISTGGSGQAAQEPVAVSWNSGRHNGQNQTQNERYYNSDGGFSTPWLALLAKRKAAGTVASRLGKSDGDDGALDLEKAQVFMLGKLLWCIFEEEALMRCGIDHEMLSDRYPAMPDAKVAVKKVFPEFEHTPDEVRGLIKRCTAGAVEWEDRAPRGWRVVLDGKGKLVPSSTCTIGRNGGSSGVGSISDCGRTNIAAQGTKHVTAEDPQCAATEYWKSEVVKARAFVASMVEYERQKRGVCLASHELNNQDGDEDEYVGNQDKLPRLLEQARSRPTLGQVLEELEMISG